MPVLPVGRAGMWEWAPAPVPAAVSRGCLHALPFVQDAFYVRRSHTPLRMFALTHLTQHAHDTHTHTLGRGPWHSRDVLSGSRRPYRITC
eukprot:2729697-Prymnesium_polylepis.1